jgi:phospholipase C
MIQNLHSNPNDVPSSQFLIDAAAGTLPNVSWLQVDDPYAEHPPDSETAGQDWMMLQVNGLMASPQWPTSAMLIVWDDWGGFYDHVLPPNVATTSSFEDQYRLGFRTGCLVISPYAKPGYISSTLYSFSSILALIEAVYNLEPLTALDRFANNMLDCFDFEQRPLPPRPAPLVGTLEREGYVGSGEPDDDEVLP